MIVIDTKVPDTKTSEAVTVTGAMNGAGASRKQKSEIKGGGPVSKSGTKTNQKTKKRKA